MAKVTQAGMNLRTAEVAKLLLSGYSRSHIVRVVGDRWKVGASQVDKYIHAASEEIKEVTKVSAERTLAVITTNLWALFRKNRKQPGYARQILMDIAKLHGLEKLDVTLHLDRPNENATDDELTKAFLGGA